MWLTRCPFFHGNIIASCKEISIKGDVETNHNAKNPEESGEKLRCARLLVDEETSIITDKHQVSLKVDVVLAIDSKASLEDDLIATQNYLKKIISNLNNGWVDPRIHPVLDVPMVVPIGSDPNNVAIAHQRLDSSDAINRLNNLFGRFWTLDHREIPNISCATSSEFPEEIEFVIISHESPHKAYGKSSCFDCNKSLITTFNSIVGLPLVVSHNSELSKVGREYITFAMQASGSALGICVSGWTNRIAEISIEMVKSRVTFPLSRQPVNFRNIIVELDGKNVDASDWVYDTKKNAISLVRCATVRDGSKLNLSYNPMIPQ